MHATPERQKKAKMNWMRSCLYQSRHRCNAGEGKERPPTRPRLAPVFHPRRQRSADITEGNFRGVRFTLPSSRSHGILRHCEGASPLSGPLAGSAAAPYLLWLKQTTSFLEVRYKVPVESDPRTMVFTSRGVLAGSLVRQSLRRRVVRYKRDTILSASRDSWWRDGGRGAVPWSAPTTQLVSREETSLAWIGEKTE